MTVDRITEFGKFVRDLRKLNKENLDMMSKKLGVSISFLSSLESGKKQVPKDFANKLISNYDLDENQIIRLLNSIELTNNKAIIQLNNLSPIKKRLVLNLARNIKDLPDDKAVEIIEMLK